MKLGDACKNTTSLEELRKLEAKMKEIKVRFHKEIVAGPDNK